MSHISLLHCAGCSTSGRRSRHTDPRGHGLGAVAPHLRQAPSTNPRDARRHAEIRGAAGEGTQWQAERSAPRPNADTACSGASRLSDQPPGERAIRFAMGLPLPPSPSQGRDRAQRTFPGDGAGAPCRPSCRIRRLSDPGSGGRGSRQPLSARPDSRAVDSMPNHRAASIANDMEVPPGPTRPAADLPR